MRKNSLSTLHLLHGCAVLYLTSFDRKTMHFSIIYRSFLSLDKNSSRLEGEKRSHLRQCDLEISKYVVLRTDLRGIATCEKCGTKSFCPAIPVSFVPVSVTADCFSVLNAFDCVKRRPVSTGTKLALYECVENLATTSLYV